MDYLSALAFTGPQPFGHRTYDPTPSTLRHDIYVEPWYKPVPSDIGSIPNALLDGATDFVNSLY